MRTKFFNAYTGFVLGAIIFGAVTFVQLPCPACNGTGTVHGVQGLEITGVESELLLHKELGLNCGWDWERYNYDVKVSVVNRSTAMAWGVIMINISNPTESITVTQEIDDQEVEVEYSGKTMQSYPVFVEIPASGTKIIDESIIYEGVTLQLFAEPKHRIDATTASEFACPFHGAKATVSLTEWLRLR